MNRKTLVKAFCLMHRFGNEFGSTKADMLAWRTHELAHAIVLGNPDFSFDKIGLLIYQLSPVQSNNQEWKTITVEALGLTRLGRKASLKNRIARATFDDDLPYPSFRNTKAVFYRRALVWSRTKTCKRLVERFVRHVEGVARGLEAV